MDHKEELYIPDCFNDDLEWLGDFMEDDEDLESLDGYDLEDEFFESHQHSDEEAAEILGSPSEGINCDSENACVICLDPLEKCYGDLKELPCKHIYHYNCILKSTKTKNSCPMCRGEYDYRETKPNLNEYPCYTEFFHSSLTARMGHGFFMPEKREADALFDDVAQVWGSLREYDYWEIKPVHIKYPRISFYPESSPCYLTWMFMDLDYFKTEMEEAFALFDEAEQVMESFWEGRYCDPKNVYAICHMKPLPRKQKYHYKCILGSTKIKRSCVMCHGNRSAGRAAKVFHANHAI